MRCMGLTYRKRKGQFRTLGPMGIKSSPGTSPCICKVTCIKLQPNVCVHSTQTYKIFEGREKLYYQFTTRNLSRKPLKLVNLRLSSVPDLQSITQVGVQSDALPQSPNSKYFQPVLETIYMPHTRIQGSVVKYYMYVWMCIHMYIYIYIYIYTHTHGHSTMESASAPEPYWK